jgi:drug/metabolite transporter (DMT)-like permease
MATAADRIASPAGIALVLLSGVTLAFAPVTAKLAYQEDVTVATLLSVRFVLAAALFWLVVAILRRPLPSRRGAVRGLLYGLVFYAVQALLLFSSVNRIDPGLAILLFYVFPALLVLPAVALGRDRFSWRRVAAIPVALTGVALVLVGPGVGAVDALGATLALLGAVAYVAFVLAGDYLAVGTDPLVLAALMGTGAIPTFVVYGLVTDSLSLSFEPRGWIWIVAVAFVSLIAFTTFFAGLERVGPSLTGLLCTSEPVATTVASAAIFGDRLTLVQGIGGALVIGAVIWVNLRANPRFSLRARRGDA